MNGDPVDDAERRQAENKFGSGPWTTDNTPITEFNGPTGDMNYGEVREEEEISPEEKKRLAEIEDELRKLLGSEDEKPAYMKEVEHPIHYCNRKMEAIEIIEMIIEIEPNAKVAYNMSNVLKYILRFRDKGQAVKDLRKAEWYLNRVITHLEQEENPTED